MSNDKVEVSSNKIDEGLNQIFTDLKGRHVTSNNLNKIFIVDVKQLDLASKWLEILTQVAPGRFFLLVIDESCVLQKIFLSAQGSQLSRGRSICSEVITIETSSNLLLAATNIIQSNLLTGRRTELVIWPCTVLETYSHELLMLGDIALIDSVFFNNSQQVLSKLVERFERIIDVQWLSITPWREAVRAAFDLPQVLRLLHSYSQIIMEVDKATNKMPMYLLIAWLCDCLNITPTSYNVSGFECHTNKTELFTVAIREVEALAARGIAALTFISKIENVPTLSLRLYDDFRLQITLADQVLLVERVEPVDVLSLLSRYYAVGESTVAYSDALKLALEFAQLKQGFL